MAVTPAGRNAFADAKASLVTALSLHNPAPDDTGSNEVTGGGYARQPPTYAAAAGGVASLSAQLNFSTPANQPVAAVGYWAGATFVGYDDTVTGDAAANAAGEYAVTQADITDA